MHQALEFFYLNHRYVTPINGRCKDDYYAWGKSREHLGTYLVTYV